MTPDKTAIMHLIFWEEQGKLIATAKMSGFDNLSDKNRAIATMAVGRIVEYMKECGEAYDKLVKEKGND
jgi:predicted GNAT family N-acyltransferase